MIRPIYKIASAPTKEPVSKTEIKMHLRLVIDADAAVYFTAEDDLIDAYIAAARQAVENIAGRSLITQTWEMYLQNWPRTDFIAIGKPPLQSVAYVNYTDANGDVTTWSTDEYGVDTDSEPGRIVLNYGNNWPSFTPHPRNPINIRFVSGYGAAGTSVPAPIIHALKLLIGHYYENREDPVNVPSTTKSIKNLPVGIRSLLSEYRFVGF